MCVFFAFTRLSLENRLVGPERNPKSRATYQSGTVAQEGVRVTNVNVVTIVSSLQNLSSAFDTVELI